MEPRAGRGASIALFLGSLLVTLLILEAGFRVAQRFEGGGKEEGTLAQYTEYDPLLGWRKRPGGRATFHRREYTVEVRINGQGLRDEERTYEPAPGAFRMLALGDSFVEAYSVPLEHSVTQVLQSDLRRPDCPVEVINGGTAAWSTDQEYLFYRSEGRRYRPQVVLLFFYYNDVYFNAIANYFGTPKPLLVEREGRLELARYPVPHPPPPSPVAPQEEPLPASALYDWVRLRLMRGAPRTYDSLAGLGLWPSIPITPPHGQLKVFKQRRIEEVEDGWTATGRILRALEREAVSAGARALVVYVPSRMEVNDTDWELTSLRYQMDEGRWDRGAVARRLREVADETGIPMLDLTTTLRAADRRLLGRPYFVHDGHWNERGHRVAARELARFLRASGWLPACTVR